VALQWALLQTFPADNAAAGLPVADKIVNNTISSVAIQDGAIQITSATGEQHDSRQDPDLRPAVVADAPIVPVTWYAATPPLRKR